MKSLHTSKNQSDQTTKHKDSSTSKSINKKAQQSNTESPQIKDEMMSASRSSNRSHSQYSYQMHDSRYCVCESCDCGKHKCKLQCTKPELKFSSTYSNSYCKTSKKGPQETHLQFTPKKAIQQFVNKVTTYQQKFSQKQIHVQEPIKYADNSKFTGPSVDITTYQEKYPGYNGKNPYVKKKPDQFRGGLKFQGKTMYDSQFLNRKVQVNQPIKHSDNLKTSTYWFGRSSYKDAFTMQNPEQFKPLDYKPKNRYQKRPSSACQYQSSYKSGFGKPIIDEDCPAQSLLSKLNQTISKHQNQKKDRKQIHFLKNSNRYA